MGRIDSRGALIGPLPRRRLQRALPGISSCASKSESVCCYLNGFGIFLSANAIVNKFLAMHHSSNLFLSYSKIAICSVALSGIGLSQVFAKEKATIDVAMIQAAQDAWGDGLIKIGAAKANGGDPKAAALEMLTTLYDYPDGKVLFKPTLTHGKNTFRPSLEGALSYFVGGNPDYPEDSGFALKGWVASEEVINSFIVYGDVVIVMGNVTLTDADGEKVTVDKTFAYRLDEEGNLRIITHHSSLPFTPDTN